MRQKLRTLLLPIWISASVIVGPFIAISQYLFTRGGGDYCDAIYTLPKGGYDPARIEEFARANTYADTLSSIAIVIGLIFIIDYWSSRHKNIPLTLRITFTSLALIMMVGYLLIIFIFSGAGKQVC